YWTAPTDRNMDNPHFKDEVQKQVNATRNAVTHITENHCTKHSRSNNESNTEATAPSKRIKTTKSSASPISDDENEEQDEPIEIDLMSIKKQLEMVPLIE
ncbi:16793_t:CDS:2, partial [Gigaspora rosea]